MKKTWIFLTNTFLVATAKSFLLAKKISQFHYDALDAVKADAFFGPLFTAYKVLHDAFLQAFTNWSSSGSVHESATKGVDDLLLKLSADLIRQWDVAIQAVFDQKSKEYLALLPDRRGPFQNGSQLEILQALIDLSARLDGFTALAALKTKVDAFIASLQQALSDQKKALDETNTFSDALEDARVKICVGMYANLGSMIAHFAATPEKIANYFALQYLRREAQVSFTNHLKPLKIKFIAKRKLKADDTLTIHNNGNGDLIFYFAKTKKDEPGKVALTVVAGDVVNVTADQLGDVTLGLIMVSNPSKTNVGYYQLDID